MQGSDTPLAASISLTTIAQGDTTLGVPRVVEELHNGGRQLHELIDVLEQRLQMVLSPQPVPGQSDKVGAEGATSALADTLHEAAHRVDSGLYRLQRLIDALDL